MNKQLNTTITMPDYSGDKLTRLRLKRETIENKAIASATKKQKTSDRRASWKK